jgi:hypothetical protein
VLGSVAISPTERRVSKQKFIDVLEEQSVCTLFLAGK